MNRRVFRCNQCQCLLDADAEERQPWSFDCSHFLCPACVGLRSRCPVCPRRPAALPRLNRPLLKHLRKVKEQEQAKASRLEVSLCRKTGLAETIIYFLSEQNFCPICAAEVQKNAPFGQYQFFNMDTTNSTQDQSSSSLEISNISHELASLEYSTNHEASLLQLLNLDDTVNNSEDQMQNELSFIESNHGDVVVKGIECFASQAPFLFSPHCHFVLFDFQTASQASTRDQTTLGKRSPLSSNELTFN